MEVCKFLESNHEYIEIIIDYLINGCISSSNNIKPSDLKQYFIAIMSSSTNNDQFMSQLKNNKHGRSRCATKWHGKHVAYRCKTCQITPSSCICVDCFNHSNHEGHDYVIYNSELGGCCDCGDPLAFNCNGFCTRHSGKMNFELPNGYKQKMYPVLHAVICNFVYYLVHRDEYQYSKEVLHKIGKWLQKLSATHDGVRHLIVEIFLSHSQYSQAKPFKKDFLSLFTKHDDQNIHKAIPKPIKEILNKLENMKWNNHNDINNTEENDDDIDNKYDDNLLALINNSINEWRFKLEKRTKCVLEAIKRGPIWKVHDFILNEDEEKYQGISHEPLGMKKYLFFYV